MEEAWEIWLQRKTQLVTGGWKESWQGLEVMHGVLAQQAADWGGSPLRAFPSKGDSGGGHRKEQRDPIIERRHVGPTQKQETADMSKERLGILCHILF